MPLTDDKKWFKNIMLCFTKKQIVNKKSWMTFSLSEEHHYSESASCFPSPSPPVHLSISAKLQWLNCTRSPRTLFTARLQQTPKYRRTPIASASAKASIPSPNGREKLLSVAQRCYLLVVRQLGATACAGSRWREARWPLSPALISCSSLEINDSCAITLRDTWRGPDSVWNHISNFSCTHLWRIHSEHLLERLKVKG